MSRSTKSASRSRSRSRSRTRSRSSSRSRSRSRSRKHRYSSRSRSRSRSRSPSYNRDKKYSRGYQNNRELRGYHRGFRRPYNFRGRGRGYFPRGRYQRGGGGGGGGGGYNNNNFRPNWKNNKQHPQKQQQYQNNSRGRGRGRANDPQKRYRSPPQSQSRHSDRSASPSSRLSPHSSSSSSHSSSPKCLTALLLGNQGSKEAKENSVSKEVPKGGGGGEGDGGLVELGGVLAEVAKDGGTGSGKTEGSGLGLTDCSSSPKRTGPLGISPLITGRTSQTINQSGPATKSTNDTNNSAPQWRPVSNSASAKNPSHEGLNPMLSSFDFYSTEEYLDEDKTAISIAFRQFLEEQNKKAASALENGKSAEANGMDVDRGKVNGKAPAVDTDSISRKYKGDSDGEVSLNSLLKTSPFLAANGEEEEEMTIKPHSKSLHRDWQNGDESSKLNSKASHSAQGLFEECLGKWKNVTYSQVSDTDLNAMAEELYLRRKQDKAFAVALSRRESTGLEELSPDRNCKARKTAKSPSVSPPTLPPRRNSDREMFMVRGGDSPVVSSRKPEAKFNVRMDFLGDGLLSSSDILAKERQLSQDLVQSSKKDQEFRSIFQHVQAAQSHRTPSELFAQHIVTIVHQTKAQYFPPSDMTLNERFTMYQRRAAEKEMMKPRKSPEIHRRLDVSTSAFKKHSQLFEAVKNPEDGTYKDGGDKIKADPMDLRLDIERRKKYSTHERNLNQDQGQDLGDLPNSSQERSAERFTKCHKRSEKSKKRSRSSSSSSSSSRASQQEEDLPLVRSDPKDEVFNKARLGQGESPGSERGRPHGFQVRICGRICNNSNCQGDSASSTTINMVEQKKTEGVEPEFTPKNRPYYLHDDRDEEANCKWTINRGRGRASFTRGGTRFIIRKAVGGSVAKNPNWAHNKFQVNGVQGAREEGMEQDHNDGGIAGDNH